jgi:hypothetical protein
VSNRVSRRQAGRWAQQEQQQAYQEPAYQEPAYQQPAPAAPAGNDMESKLAQLKDLGALKEQGVLTDAEFEVQKSRILNS